jgi:predicted PurR-regulated permease PerM
MGAESSMEVEAVSPLGDGRQLASQPGGAPRPRGSVLRALIAGACVVVVLAGVEAAAKIVNPTLLALMVTFVSLPFFHWLRARGVWSWLAVLLTILTDVALLAGAGFLLTGSIQQLARELPKYSSRADQLLQHSIEWLAEHEVPVPGWAELEPTTVNAPAMARGGAPAFEETYGDAGALEGGAPAWWMTFFDMRALLDLANRTLRGVATAASTAIIVVFITTFILLEAGTFRDKLRLALGHRDWADRLGRVTLELRRYLVIKFWISLAAGIWLGVWVALLGLDFPIFWGAMLFVLHFIPNIGALLASVPPIFLGLVQGGPFLAFMVAIAYLTVNVLLGNLIEPHLQGKSLGLSTLVVFLSLMFWGWLLGPVGMLLSVPLTTAAKIVCENVDGLRWAAVLLGDAPSAKRRRRIATRREAAAAD